MSDLTTEEQKNVRTALRFLKTRCGKLETLATLLHFQRNGIRRVLAGRRPVSASMAFRVARFAKVGVNDLLAGRFPEPGTCAHCGHRDEAAE